MVCLYLFCWPFSDSSLRVKDVMKEFHAGGRLVQHRFGEVSWREGPSHHAAFVRSTPQCDIPSVTVLIWSLTSCLTLTLSASMRLASIISSRPTWRWRISLWISANAFSSTSRTLNGMGLWGALHPKQVSLSIQTLQSKYSIVSIYCVYCICFT